MKEDTRANLHLDVISLSKAIEHEDDSVLFYVLADNTYDIVYVGDTVALVNVIMNCMNDDETIREIFMAAVDLYNENNPQFNLN